MSCRTDGSSTRARRTSCSTWRNSERPTSESLDISPSDGAESREARVSEARAFEGLLRPPIVHSVHEAVPDADRPSAFPGGRLVRRDDLFRPANLVLRRGEDLVRETHLVWVHDLLADVTEAFRLQRLRPEAVVVLEIEEHPVDRLEAVRRGGDHQTRLDVDVTSVCLDVAPHGRGAIPGP